MKDTDLDLSCVCLGGAGFGNTLSEKDTFSLLDAFVGGGGNFIDTANVYCRWVPGLENCSERIIGRWLRSRKMYGKVTVATKGAHYTIDDAYRTPRLSKSEIRSDLEDSLKALGTDVIDFYWLHRDDTQRPVEEITDSLEEFRKDGMIRYYGFSNFTTERVMRARAYLNSAGLNGPYAVSNQWSMASVNRDRNINRDPTLVLFDENEYKMHEATGLPAVPYSSTALGFFDKLNRYGEDMPRHIYDAYYNEDNVRKYKMLIRLSEETGHSVHALSIAWLLSKRFQVFPVCGASNTAQLNDIMTAADIDVNLFQEGGFPEL